jgi:hypothetical protein
MGQAGWMALLVGLTPMVMFFTVNPIHLAVGDFTWWQVMAAPGCNLLLLALFPTDARAIRAVGSAFFSGCYGRSVLCLGRGPLPNAAVSWGARFAATPCATEAVVVCAHHFLCSGRCQR